MDIQNFYIQEEKMVRIQKYLVKFAQNYIFCQTQRVETLINQRMIPWQININALKTRLTKKDQKKKKVQVGKF